MMMMMMMMMMIDEPRFFEINYEAAEGQK